MPQHNIHLCDIFTHLTILVIFVMVSDIHFVLASEKCIVNNVDFSILEKYGPWEATSDDWNVTYKINICGANEVTGNLASECHKDTSICMLAKGARPLSVGNQTVGNITAQVNEKLGELTIVKQGDPCSDMPGEVHTTFLMMKCGKTLGSPRVLDYHMCTTYIEWHTTAMCSDALQTENEIPCYLLNYQLKEKFDLNPLIKTTGGYLVEASDGWQFYINVCRDIKPDTATSRCKNGSGACRFNNATFIDMGHPQGRLQKTVNGNLMLQYSSDTAVDGCTVKPTTTIEFICPRAGGSKDPLLELDFNCQYKVIWKTEHACGESAISSRSSCRLTKEDRNIDIDLTPLRNSPGADRPYEVFISPFRYFINVCGELGLECPDDNHVQDVAACQTKVGDSNYGFVLGKTTHQLLKYVDGELTLTYRAGDKCNHNKFQRTIVITFQCNRTAGNLGKGQPVFNKEDDCTYLFDWQTKYACLDHPVSQECRVNYGGKRIDLSPLVRQSGENWDVLEGGDNKNHLSLYYINICNDILKTGQATKCKPDSSVCLIDDTGTHSLGQYAENPRFLPITNSVRITYRNGDICSGTRRTISIIEFICTPGDLQSGPVLLRHSLNKCIYEFEWHTAAACVLAEKLGTNCKVYDDDLGINFDLNRLTKPKGQFYNVTSGSYDYLMNICDSVSGTKCDVNGRNTPNPGVCQVKHGGSNSDAFNTGQANSTIKYFDGMVKVVYDNGDPYNSQPPRSRRTEIAMLCDREAGSGVPQFVQEANNTYSFTWNTMYACPNQPVECTASNSNGEKQYDLSSLGRTDVQDNWVIIDDTDPNNKIKFYINVCRSLNEVKVGTGCSPFAAVCATKITNGVETIDNQKTNLGEVKVGPLVQSEGTLILKYVSHKQDCIDGGQKKNFTSSLHFVCKRGALSSGPNQPIKIGNCEYSFLWETEAACPIVDSHSTSAEKCVIKNANSDYTFNLQPLEKKGNMDYYEVTGPNGRKFRLNICGGISESNCANVEGKMSSMCEVLSNGSKPGLAMTNEKLDYSDDGRLILSYDGPRDMTSGKRLQVVILFLCRQTIPLGQPVFSRLEDNTYYFEFKTSLACHPQPVDCLVQDDKGTQYDLSPLAKVDTNWDVVDTRKDHSDLRYYINVCRPINAVHGASCPGGPVGGCQVNNGGHSFSMGYIQSKPVVTGNGTITLLYKNGDLCHRGKPTQSHRSTRINFLCSATEQNPVFEMETETCEYIFTWQTPAACPLQREIGKNCTVIDPTYNYMFDLNPLRKIGSNYEVSNGEYKYLLNVCGPLSPAGLCSSGVSSCQTKPSDGSFHFNAGQSSSEIVYDAGEITLKYTNGDACHNKTFNRSTVITFVCDQSKDGSQGPNYLNETSDCVYLFEWPTKLACTPFKVGECAITDKVGQQYDLSKLALSNDNYEENDFLEKKKYIFNVCRSLVSQKGETCPFNAAVCEINLKDSNLKTKYHNIGEVNENQILFDNNRLELHYTNGELCSDNKTRVSTRIILHCDERAIDSHPTGHFFVGCEHRFVWVTAGACPLNSVPSKTNTTSCTVANPNTGYVFNLMSLKSPTGYQIDDNKGHLFRINICDTVKGTGCTNSQTGACQVEKAGDKRSFNVGNANGKLQYDDGYLFLNYSGGDKCHNGAFERNIIISFICSQTAGTGHPQFIAETASCTYQMVWYTSLACENEIKCSVDKKDYSVDLSPLIKTYGHYLTIPTTVSGVPANSSFYINVCRPLNPIYGTLCPPGASACMITPGQDPVSLGKLHQSPFVDKHSRKITILYDHGTPCRSDSTKNYTSKIIFVCKSERSLGQPLLVQVTSDCQYIFLWDTHIVCESDEVQEKNTSDCTFRDPATRAMFNFTSLRSSKPYMVTTTGNKYLINVCGPVTSSLPGCLLSSICEVNATGGFGYGKTSTGAFIQTSDVLKLIYEKGDTCEGNTKSEGVIDFICDAKEYPGHPEPLYTGPCQTVFVWKTRVACSGIADQCSLAYGNHLYDLSILSSQTSSWNLHDTQGNSYWINICQGVHNSPDSMKCPNTAGACRKTPQGEVDSLGVVTTQKLYMDKDGKTIILEYSNGDATCAHKQRRSDNSFATTIIKFECGNTVGGPVYVPNTKSTNSCVFEFRWKSRVACQVIRQKVQENNGKVRDPESGGVIDLEQLKIFQTVQIDNYNRFEIDFTGRSTKCGSGSVVCKVGTGNEKKIIGKTGQKQYFIEDEIFEIVYSTSTTCDKYKTKNISTTIQLHCNPQQSKPFFMYESQDCMYLFIWETPVACLKPNVVAPSPSSGSANSLSGTKSGGTKPGTVVAIVSVFMSAIIICVLLIVFHKKERRAAFATRIRNLVQRSDTTYNYASLPQADGDEYDDELLHSISADDLGLQGSVEADNDEVNILSSNDNNKTVDSYHDDSDEDILA